MRLVRDKSRSKSHFYWRCQAKLEMKKERFISYRHYFKFWEEKPYRLWSRSWVL